jgi:hypothetical protein
MNREIKIDPDIYELGFSEEEISDIIDSFDALWSEDSVTEIELGFILYRKWIKNNVVHIHVSISDEDSLL